MREIMEYKYSSPHKKSTSTIRKRERVFEFVLAKSREKQQNFKSSSKIKGLLVE
jgi:hypothetical protein